MNALEDYDKLKALTRALQNYGYYAAVQFDVENKAESVAALTEAMEEVDVPPPA